MKKIFLFTLLISGLASKLFAQSAPLDQFKADKFGMFLHWGLYAQTAGDWKNHVVKGGEHFMLYERIPVAEYGTIANQFNPIKFDADAWVKQAKATGMKYIVFTAKHHDGFAMYNSASSDYNIVKRSPFKRDPIAELAKACKKYQLTLCLYYSLGRDWQDPDVPTNWPLKRSVELPKEVQPLKKVKMQQKMLFLMVRQNLLCQMCIIPRKIKRYMCF